MSARDFEAAYKMSINGPDPLYGLVPDTSYRDSGMGSENTGPISFDGNSRLPDGDNAYDNELAVLPKLDMTMIV